MRMYLVLCYDPRPRQGWFAYSGALKTRAEAETILNQADKINWMTGKPIKYKIIDFWMGVE